MSGKKINIVALGVFLCLVCASSTAVMAFFHSVTKKPIEDAKVRKMIGGLKKVLPRFDNDPAMDSVEVEGVKFYRARIGGSVVAAAAEAESASGYGGRIKGLVGFSPDGRILNFIVTGHNETPGLGTKLTDPDNSRTILDLLGMGKKKKESGSNRYLDQFKGHFAGSADAWKKHPWTQKSAGGEVDGVSGATITSKAVTELAWKASELVLKHRNRIFETGKKECPIK